MSEMNLLLLILTAKTDAYQESSLFGLSNGLAPAPTGLFGLGALGDLGVDQSPSPPIGLASPFARLAKTQACAYFSPPTDNVIHLSDSTSLMWYYSVAARDDPGQHWQNTLKAHACLC
ncbi:hypothetical protein DFH08DRAFT_816892 [Mycena albidolilacea]|uniref:Uncharacterized protein n=1 Tax=Mycena albidolilacea TaxID=1033008 RepID=A0AAD6ZJ44_9AGAR|nr:hypothetical protein DFH08DRAFT_816892 [Mycena albidolilacea]